MQAEADSSFSSDPFRIIHNFRASSSPHLKPKRKASACERYHPAPEFTMRTRKMTEVIEQRLLPSYESSNYEEQGCFSNPPRLDLDRESFLQPRQEALENGIPLGGEDEKEGLFNFNENSCCSNYSKLERTLFGFTMLGEQIEEE